MAGASTIPFRHRLAVRQAAPILAGLGLLLGLVLFVGYRSLRENILTTAQDRVRQISSVAGTVLSQFQRRAEEKNAAVVQALQALGPEEAIPALGRDGGIPDRVITSLLALEKNHRRLDVALTTARGQRLTVSYARDSGGEVIRTALWREGSPSGEEKGSGLESPRLPPGAGPDPSRPGRAMPVSSPEGGERDILMRYATPLDWADGGSRAFGHVSLTVNMTWLTSFLDSMTNFEGLDSFILSSEGLFLISRDVFAVGSLPELSARIREPALEALGRSMLAGEQGDMVIPWGGMDRLALYMPLATKGLSLALLIPEETLSRPLKMLGRQIIVLVLALILLAVAGLYGITRATLHPVRSLMNMAERLSRRDFSADPPPARKGLFPGRSVAAVRLDETGRLLRAANTLRLALRQRLEDLTLAAAARERLSSELALARDIQEGVRPRILPQTDSLKLAAVLRGIHPVSSTLYDAFFRSGRSLCCILVDVVAQGIPAALFMGRVMPLLRETLLAGSFPGQALETVNNILHIGKEAVEAPVFAHILAGTLDSVSGVFSWAGAGPSLPVLVRGGRATAMNSARNDPLGMRPRSSFPGQSLRLLPGDMLFLSTEGLGLARPPDGVPYREARLLSFLSARAEAGRRQISGTGEDPREGFAWGEALLRAVLEDVARCAAPDEPREDAALMLIHWKGSRRKAL
ncbi:MAG: SpoIIE family protein phosphatase [Desulfovibrio sp.]|jgi:sigma-B regulation protein RsbU (phosphoserine phosphatase)|nr:SpoIIE family protein phosphatase [Desulfovibrio sp.]